MANDNKKISVFLGHPAHFHLYKYVVDGLIKKQYNELLNDDDDEPTQPEDYDYSDSVSISCDIGGYKD